MITVQIKSGISGFSSVLRAHRIQPRSVGITIKIGCGQVTAFGDLLKSLKLEDVIKIPLHKNIVYGKAGKYNSPFRLPCALWNH